MDQLITQILNKQFLKINKFWKENFLEKNLTASQAFENIRINLTPTRTRQDLLLKDNYIVSIKDIVFRD